MGSCLNNTIASYQFPYYIEQLDTADVFCCQNTDGLATSTICQHIGCEKPQQFATAKAMCESQDMHICSETELNSGICCNFECESRVWTTTYSESKKKIMFYVVST